MARGRKKQKVGQLDAEGDRLVLANMDLVERVAFHVGRTSGLTHEERLEIGMHALCEAAVRYDPKKGPFKPFAQEWIRGLIRKAADELQPHLAARRGYTREEILAGKDKDGRELSLSDPHGLLAGPLPIDQIIDPTTTLESKAIRAELKIIAHEVVDQFSPGPRAMLEALYFEEISMAEYAARVDLDRSTIKRHRDEIFAVLLPRLVRRLAGG
jgi:RNA polymerase sigma factor (sigma-70 family)